MYGGFHIAAFAGETPATRARRHAPPPRRLGARDVSVRILRRLGRLGLARRPRPSPDVRGCAPRPPGGVLGRHLERARGDVDRSRRRASPPPRGFLRRRHVRGGASLPRRAQPRVRRVRRGGFRRAFRRRGHPESPLLPHPRRVATQKRHPSPRLQRRRRRRRSPGMRQRRRGGRVRLPRKRRGGALAPRQQPQRHRPTLGRQGVAHIAERKPKRPHQQRPRRPAEHRVRRTRAPPPEPQKPPRHEARTGTGHLRPAGGMAQGDPDRDGPDRRLVFQRGRASGVGDPREVDVRGALRVDDVRRRVQRFCRFSTHPRRRRHARRLRTPRVSTAPFERARADAVERVARRQPRRRAERYRDASSRTRRGRGTSTRVRARRSTYVGRFRRR